MTSALRPLIVLTLLSSALSAQTSATLESHLLKKDVVLTADPSAAHWKKVKPVIAEGDRYGKPVPGHRTEIRSRWTKDNLYILYVCPYDSLFLKPDPSTTTETNKLWDYDVAEAFIGTDFQNIMRYRELQVSPQGEWVDLDIDRQNPKPEGGWRWNSGYEVKARIDKEKKIWYGEMKIPFAALYFEPATPKAGDKMRINCFRIQGGPGDARRYIAWQAPNKPSYHTPEAFGTLLLTR